MSRENNNNNNNNEQLCWFHEKLTREAAEALIKQDEAQENGTFLVRESTTAAGDYVLTLLFEGEVCHYQIRRHGEDAFFSIDDKVRILHGLDTLVEFYKEEPHGLVTKLTKHIKKDLPPNHTRSHGVTNLLHRATKENNRTVVTEMLKCGYRNVDAKNQFGQTALHLAAIHCDEEILQLLIDAGVSVNVMDTSGNMPLHYACQSKPASFIRILLAANANVQGRNISNGYVPLHEAAKHGNLEAVIELLAAHAPLLPRTKSGEFPIDLAKEQMQNAVVDYLNNYKVAPANTLQSHWYHGTLTRDEAVETVQSYAEQLLESKAPQEVVDEDKDKVVKPLDKSGCFLVRYSPRAGSSGYVLTLLWNEQIKHYQISQSSKYLYIDEGPYLPSLEHLIEHFMRFADGLPVSLKHPIKPKPKPPVPLFSTIPRTPRRVSESSVISPTKPVQIPGLPHSATMESLKSPNTQYTAQTLGHKKKTTGSVFNTLRLTSPRKPKFDMNSLRKSKTKTKSGSAEQQKQAEQLRQVDKEAALKTAHTLLKNLSFSTDFVNLQALGTDAAGGEVYNVPMNNAAVEQHLKFDNKTAEEEEYLTKSDIAIAKERLEQAKAAALSNTSIPANTTSTEADQKPPLPSTAAPNPTDYIRTVDVRVFMDPLMGDISQEMLEASAAELRQISKHPERLESFLSTASTDSEMNRYLNRQTSNASGTTLNSEGIDTPTGLTPMKFNYFIPRDCLQLSEIIGEGEFGSVYKGYLKRSSGGIVTDSDTEQQLPVAIKTLRDEHCRTNKQEFLREASVMIKLNHHCIVRLIGISKGDSLMMVQEFVPLGSMLQYILIQRPNINPNYELKLWASQIACGMEFLESQHFVHRDLAARNILLASRHQAKISDFGLSRALVSGNECYQATQGGKWPIKWYAPESFNNGIFSHASDVWSFGVTLWEMFSLGEAPYGDKRGIEAIQLIESGERLPQPENCPPHVYEIMKNCWNYKPKDRPSFRFLTEFFGKDPDYQNIMELVKTEHIC